MSSHAPTTAEIIERMTGRRPCDSAVSWLGSRTPERAWRECPRGDWLLWWAAHSLRYRPGSTKHRAIVAAGIDCAATASRWMSHKSRRVLTDLRRWLRGVKVDLKKVCASAASAADWAAADADAAVAAYYAAYAAAYDAAYAYAAAASASAADAAACDAAYAAYAAAQQKHADIVRRHIPWARMAQHVREVCR